MRRCLQCRQRFEPRVNTLQGLCSPACALEWVKSKPDRAEALRKRAAAKERREYKVDNETASEARAKAQKAFNAWVRARDAEMPCISCGRYDLSDPLTGGAWDAGHYRTVAACPQLRFEPDNCHKQCKRCNQYFAQSVEHKAGVMARIGLDRFEWIEGPHPLPHWTRDDYREIAERFRSLTREISKRAA